MPINPIHGKICVLVARIGDVSDPSLGSVIAGYGRLIGMGMMI